MRFLRRPNSRRKASTKALSTFTHKPTRGYVPTRLLDHEKTLNKSYLAQRVVRNTIPIDHPAPLRRRRYEDTTYPTGRTIVKA